MTMMMKPPSQPEWPVGRPQAIPRISADLLPPEVVASRAARRARRQVLLALAGCLVLLAAWYGTAVRDQLLAADELAEAQTTVGTLTRQQNEYAELVAIQAERKTIDEQLSALLVSDLSWAALIGAVRNTAPKGVQITGVTGALSEDTGEGAQQPSSGLPSAGAATPVGTLTVTGSANTKAQIATYVDALAKVAGVGDPLVGDVTLSDGKLQFSVRADITDSIFTSTIDDAAEADGEAADSGTTSGTGTN